MNDFFNSFYRSSKENYNLKIHSYIPLTSKSIKIVTDDNKEYSKLKKQKNTLDFNDLEYYCIEILKDATFRENI